MSFTLCNTGPCIVKPVKPIDCVVSEWSVWNATWSLTTFGAAEIAAAEASKQAAPVTEAQALAQLEAAQIEPEHNLTHGLLANGHTPSNAHARVVYLDKNGFACSAECGGGWQFRNRTIVRRC